MFDLHAVLNNNYVGVKNIVIFFPLDFWFFLLRFNVCVIYYTSIYAFQNSQTRFAVLIFYIVFINYKRL
jgi:hypothetical protein